MKYSDNHTVYINKNGKEVPSATTVLKILNKPAVVRWANYLGFSHLDVDNVLSDAAALGTLIHDLINSILSHSLIIYISNPEISDTTVFSYINRFKIWLNSNTVKPIFLEKSFTSDLFGGTLDFYGEVNGKKTIIDFKTSKKIRVTMFFQLALYCVLLEERGFIVEQVGILLVNPKNKDEKYISRENLQEYIDFALKLVELFHSYFDLNDKYKWNEPIT